MPPSSDGRPSLFPSVFAYDVQYVCVCVGCVCEGKGRQKGAGLVMKQMPVSHVPVGDVEQWVGQMMSQRRYYRSEDKVPRDP